MTPASEHTQAHTVLQTREQIHSTARRSDDASVDRRGHTSPIAHLLIVLLGLILVFGPGCKSAPEEDDAATIAPDPLELEQPEIDPNSLALEALAYTVRGEEQSGILCRYPGLIRAPVLIMLHDELGFDAWFLKRAENYARLNPGVVVVAPDLRDLPADAPAEVVAENIRAATDAAIERVGYRSQPRIGAIGWSTGGVHALTAGRLLDLDLVIICYGRLSGTEEELFDLREPVRGIFGQQDEVVPLTQVVDFRERMARLAGDFEAQVWQEEGHGFLRTPVDATNAREAEDEIIFWIDRYLIMD